MERGRGGEREVGRGTEREREVGRGRREREGERERERCRAPTLFLDLKAKLAKARAFERSMRSRKNGRASLRKKKDSPENQPTQKHTTFL